MPENGAVETPAGARAATGPAEVDRRRPKRGWYVLAAATSLIAVVLAGVYWVLSLQAFGDTVAEFERFTPPGELVESFDPGSVHVYAEPGGDDDSRPSAPTVEVFSPAGSPVQLIPYLRLPGTNDGWTYDVEGYRGMGLTSFFVDEPGEYRVVAAGGDGVVLALGEGIGQEREKITFNAFGYAFLGCLAGGAIAGVVARMRSRSVT